MALFPTPVAKVPLPPYVSFDQEFSFIKSLEIRSDVLPDDVDPTVRRTSVNSYILELEQLKKLRAYIEEHINTFAYEVMCFSQKFQITQSWANLNKPNEYTHQHGHPNSIVSAVMYLDTPEGVNSLKFHNRNSHSGSYYFQINTDQERIPNSMFAYEWVSVEVKRGELLIFPSYLNHSVPKNKTPHNRWSISLNSVPVGALGSEYSLTQLLLGSISELHKQRT